MDSLFGPDSAVWQLHSDFSGLIGGLRALAVQSLEPGALAGVRQFSRFGDHPDRRLNETVDFIDTVTYAPLDEVKAAIKTVRTLHEPVHGVVPETGSPFSANDPYLLSWVHNAMVESVSLAYLSFHPDSPSTLLNRYVSEMGRFAELMGCDMGEVPGDYATLNRWVWRQPSLVVNDATVEAFALLDQLRPQGFVGQVYPVVMHWIYTSLPRWVTMSLGQNPKPFEEAANWLLLKVGGELSNLIAPPSPRRVQAQARYANSDDRASQ